MKTTRIEIEAHHQVSLGR